MKLATISFLLSLNLFSYVSAWGGLGHMTIAYIAENFMHPDTKTYFEAILNEQGSGFAARVATWADSYRYTHDGRFSAPFHFIDANDDPPTSCGVRVSRDCGLQGCVVGAIKNYTTRVMDDTLDPVDRAIAAKFVIHLVGDTHQPLHDEALDRGGNGVKCLFNNKKVNLHSVWDTYIPEAIVGGYELSDADRWAKTLTASIKSGEYKSKAASWREGINLDDPIDTVLRWSSEANAYVCSTVIPEGADAYVDRELAGGDYYTAAVPVVEEQVAKGGYRLAAWMDLIAGAESDKFVHQSQDL